MVSACLRTNSGSSETAGRDGVTGLTPIGTDTIRAPDGWRPSWLMFPGMAEAREEVDLECRLLAVGAGNRWCIGTEVPAVCRTHSAAQLLQRPLAGENAIEVGRRWPITCQPASTYRANECLHVARRDTGCRRRCSR